MAENDDKGGGDEAAAAALVTEATSMGWSPLEGWRGDPEKWIDAETFVARGREVLPILRANNKHLQAKVDTLSGQLDKVTEQLTSSQDAIEALKEFNSAATLQEAERTKSDLVASLKQARTDGDVDTEITLREQIDEVSEVIKASKIDEEAGKPKPKSNGEDKGPKISPETKAAFEAWQAKNTWFGTDVRRTRLATAISDELRADPANAALLGEAFMDKVAEEVEKTIGGSNGSRTNTDKVEGSRGGSGGRSSGGKSYADLPADAKEACSYYSKRLVGEGRAYKTEAEWQKAYTTKYFAEGQTQ